jgi:hypothetical protein
MGAVECAPAFNTFFEGDAGGFSGVHRQPGIILCIAGCRNLIAVVLGTGTNGNQAHQR